MLASDHKYSNSVSETRNSSCLLNSLSTTPDAEGDRAQHSTQDRRGGEDGSVSYAGGQGEPRAEEFLDGPAVCATVARGQGISGAGGAANRHAQGDHDHAASGGLLGRGKDLDDIVADAPGDPTGDQGIQRAAQSTEGDAGSFTVGSCGGGRIG